jgi:K+-transporting ATPase ATPase A chain
LPLNPQHFSNVPWALALNTAISFITNTNWQAYSGENTMSYMTQMAGLAVHNFLNAASHPEKIFNAGLHRHDALLEVVCQV